MTVDNAVTEAMKINEAIRLCYYNKWMIYDGNDNTWVVFGRKKHSRTTKELGRCVMLEDAIDTLKRHW